jgi:hypothetical protein
MPVTITHEKAEFCIKPACSDVLDRLVSIKRVVKNTPGRGCRFGTEVTPLYWDFDEAPLGGQKVRCRVVARGLVLPACCMLQMAGRDIKYVSIGTKVLGEPDLAAVQRHGPTDEGLLSLVREHRWGLVRHGKQVDPAWLITQVALAYPDASIVVPVARKADVTELTGKLRCWIEDVTPVWTGREPARTGRVVVGLYLSLGYGSVRLAQRNVVIAPHALEILSQRGWYPLNFAWRARVFGLLPDGTRLSPYDEAELRAAFGLAETYVPTTGRRELRVQLSLEKITGDPSIPADADLQTLKRSGIWRHPVRNRRLARLAEALSAGEPVHDRRSPGQEGGPEVPGPRRVAIVVENVEHAIVLAKRLPGWAVVTSDDVFLARLSRDDRQLLAYRRADAGRQDKVIATMAAEAIRPTELDVLIRADGGVGLPSFPEGALLVDGSSDAALDLVDFNDRHHPGLRKRSQRRREAYRRRGWYPPGTDPLTARFEDWLEGLPRI